ncbi:translin-associated protein X-like [Tachypleus tridentatus]|uniref:translin-associated protein X-like n=1 Tax=Tachypleus tridentatus TaxID=6853 RepID=UPI003FD0A4B7
MSCKEETAEKLLSEASIRIKELQSSNLRKIAEQLQDEDIFYFLRSISPGLQEYVEAVSFYYYLKDNRLVGFEELEAELVFCKENDVSSKEDSQLSKQVKVPLPPQDYMLGIADLTGELMRKCINSVGQGNLEEPFQLCHFIQNIYDAFLSFGNTPGREFSRKIQTLRQSLKKVENACYTIRVRGSEIPKHMLIHVFNEEISENLECDLTV